MKTQNGKVYLDGLVVRDATKPADIVVSKRDVARSVPGDSTRCAIAMACERYDSVIESRVYRSVALLRVKNTFYRYRITPRLFREIRALDLGGAFQPGTYRLGTIQPSNRLGMRNRYNKDHKKLNRITGRRLSQRRHYEYVGIRGRAPYLLKNSD